MNDSQIAELDAGQRVRAYASTRPADFAAGSRAAAVLAILVAAITGIEQQAAKQLAASLDRQESTEQKRVAINTMVRMMQAINLIARSINEQFPGLADQFKMGRGGDQATISRARAFIIAATPLAAEFIARGLALPSSRTYRPPSTPLTRPKTVNPQPAPHRPPPPPPSLSASNNNAPPSANSTPSSAPSTTTTRPPSPDGKPPATSRKHPRKRS
jgi:hypothetical protein